MLYILATNVGAVIAAVVHLGLSVLTDARPAVAAAADNSSHVLPQHLVPRLRHAAATRQRVQTIIEAGRELFDPERVRTRCGQLDR
jgi:hypothetical protein